MTGTKVLLVEDDESVTDALTEGLTRYGYRVSPVTTGAAALAGYGDHEVILLDLGLPDMDGLDICRALRERTDATIIVITARDTEADAVVGLELGADDYVSKPFGVRELIARIRAVHRRRQAGRETTDDEDDQRLGDLLIDRRGRRVLRQAEEIALTPTEFDILSLMAEVPGTAFTREQLVQSVWSTDWVGPSRTLDVHVAALRRKLGDSVTLSTVRGIGFRLDKP